MAIATAVKRGSVVYVYDEKNRLLLSITAGHKPEDGLVGYTSTTVSVRRGGCVHLRREEPTHQYSFDTIADRGGRRG
jgi:hypothetical protein